MWTTTRENVQHNNIISAGVLIVPIGFLHPRHDHILRLQYRGSPSAAAPHGSYIIIILCIIYLGIYIMYMYRGNRTAAATVVNNRRTRPYINSVPIIMPILYYYNKPIFEHFFFFIENCHSRSNGGLH